jgi:hypothetical protein
MDGNQNATKYSLPYTPPPPQVDIPNIGKAGGGGGGGGKYTLEQKNTKF